MANYKWVLCDNKINIINDVMNGLVDFKNEQYTIIHLHDCNMSDLEEWTVDGLRDFVISEDIKLFKKVFDK